MFHVGQKVVCVDDAESGLERPPACLHRGSVYHIRASFVWPEGPGVYLEEIKQVVDERGIEYGYHASRFRPVRKTDISIFTNMLNTKPLTEKVG